MPDDKIKKPAFGGYQLDFAGRTETMEEVFGTEPITPAEMTAKLWAYVRAVGIAPPKKAK